MTGRVSLLVWLAGLALAVLVIARGQVSTDMSAFLPRSATPAQQMLVDQLREGVVSRLVLVGIEGASPEVLAGSSRSLAADLRGDAGFSQVANGDTAALGRERDILLAHRYLLSPAVTPAHFEAAGLHAALLEDAALLGSDLDALVKRTLPADPTGETLLLVQDLAGRSHPRGIDGVWFDRAGTTALLTVSTRAAGFDIDAQEAGLGRIRDAFAALPGAGAARLVLTGPPVFAVASRARIKGDAERLSIVATLLVAGVLLVAYRSVRMLVLGLVPVASGALAGVAAVELVYGFVHGITLGFGVTLIGEAVDYAIYLFTQTPQGAAPRATLPRIWPTLRLGMLTSVVGFSAMLLSNFVGFAQLGLFTIAGLLTALAVTRYVLPALLPEALTRRSSTVAAVPVLALIRYRLVVRWVVLGLVAVAGASIALHGRPFWEDELSSMSPIPAEEQAQDRRLRAELGAPDVRYLLVADGADRERALVAAEGASARLQPLVAAGAIGGFETPSRWLPSEATQRARRDALPEAGVLAAALDRAVVDTPFRAESFAPFLVDSAVARAGPLLRHEDLDGSALGMQVDTLLSRRGAGWIAMLPLSHVADPASFARTVAGWPGAPVFLDLKRESDDLLASYRGEAVTLSLVGALAILVLLSLSLRSPARIVAVLLPLAAAVICTAAIVLAGGQRLSIFNLFGLLLVVAVGSNYCLFFEREGADQRRMVASLALADLCTVIGFGILSFSLVPVLHGIGGTVAVGAFLSLVFGAVLSTRR